MVREIDGQQRGARSSKEEKGNAGREAMPFCHLRKDRERKNHENIITNNERAKDNDGGSGKDSGKRQ